MAHTLGECFSLNTNKSTSYLSLCLSLNFLQWDIKSLSFIRSWSHAPWILARLKSWERWAEGQEEKERKRKNVPRNSLHNLLENLLNTWPGLTVFIGLILGIRPAWEPATKQPLPESLNCTHCRSPIHGVFEGNKKGEIVKESRFC